METSTLDLFFQLMFILIPNILVAMEVDFSWQRIDILKIFSPLLDSDWFNIFIANTFVSKLF